MQKSELINRIFEESPSCIFKKVEFFDEGEGAVLFYLYKNRKCYPKDLIEKLHISSARVAAILRQLEKKKHIIRKTNIVDKRKIDIEITSLGINEILNKRNNIEKTIDRLIERLGSIRFEEFLNACLDIKEIMEEK